MKEIYREAIITFAECGMKASPAARKLFVSPQAFVARLTNIRKTTGLDPRNFFDLEELYRRVTAAQRVVRS